MIGRKRGEEYMHKMDLDELGKVTGGIKLPSEQAAGAEATCNRCGEIGPYREICSCGGSFVLNPQKGKIEK